MKFFASLKFVDVVQNQLHMNVRTISTHWNTNSLLIDMTTKFHIDRCYQSK